jgi:DNA-binding LacI/PurR family transcriptional regulator
VSKESHGLVQRICPAIKTVEEDFQEAGKGLGNMLLKQLADPSALPQSWIETPRF